MTANYQDWLFQPVEIDYSEPFEKDDPRIPRDGARFYYQGYLEAEIAKDMMKIEDVLKIIESSDKSLWDFIRYFHGRNRALAMWVFEDDEPAPEACPQEARKEITRRNVLRHYLKGDNPDLIEELMPGAGAIFAQLKADTPALWDFIDRRNRALNASPPTPFEMDEPTEVFVWNLLPWKIESFAAFVNRDALDIKNRLDTLRKVVNSQEVHKYEVDEATKKAEPTWGDDAAVRRATVRDSMGLAGRAVLITWI